MQCKGIAHRNRVFTRAAIAGSPGAGKSISYACKVATQTISMARA